jgi:hypothetical protein
MDRGAIKESKEGSSRDGVERIRKANGDKNSCCDTVWFHNEDIFSNNIL